MKNKMKGATKLPKNHIMVGMTAFLFLLSAPLMVAIVDANAHVDEEHLIEYDEDSLFLRYQGHYTDTDGTSVRTEFVNYPNWNAYTPSENDGSYMILLSDLSSKTQDVLIALSYPSSESSSIFGSGEISKIVIRTPVGLSQIRYNGNFREDGAYKSIFFTETSPGVWEYEFSTAERLIYSSREIRDEKLTFYFSDEKKFPSDKVLEFSVEFYEDPTPYYYATFVWAAIGLLLLVCALFATDTVDAKTVTKGLKNAGKKAKKAVSGKGGKK